jgi:hypothetical protein
MGGVLSVAAKAVETALPDFCHSVRSEEFLCSFRGGKEREILRCAQNDKLDGFLCNVKRRCLAQNHAINEVNTCGSEGLCLWYFWN